VLIVDPATNRFASYDRDGQQVHDYSAHLDFGAGFGARSVWREDGPGTSWDANAPSGAFWSPPPANGFDQAPMASALLISAATTAGDHVSVKAVRADGTLIGSASLSGAWNAMQLSPRRVYIAAQGQAANPNVNAVFRLSDGQKVWQGSAVTAGFTPDDRHFVYLPGNVTALPRVLDLVQGAETASTSSQIPLLSGLTLGLYGVVNDWAVLGTQWNGYGLLLWAVDWQGSVTRFGSDMPMAVDETLHGFDPGAAKAVFSRQANGSDGQPTSYLGGFAFDFAAKASTPWNGIDFTCFGRPSEVAFRIVGSTVQSCSCADSTCQAIATLPALTESWVPVLLVSDDRQTIVVDYQWPFQRAPTSFPDILALRASGQMIARLSFGFAQMDNTGRLLVLSSFVSGPHAGQLGIVNLVAGTVVYMDGASGYSIIYE